MRAGIFQCAGGGLDSRQRIEKLHRALQQHSVDLIVCPELFMSGYSVGDDIRELAEPVQGRFARQVAELARANNTAILYGYPERVDDRLYNSAACVNAAGKTIANHRKLMLPPGFESNYFEEGESLTFFELVGIQCAILICYDAEYPETVRAVAGAGAQLVIVPTALVENWHTVAYQMMPTRAFENGIWLMYANHAGVENTSRYLGGSCIVAPDGKDAARAGSEEEVIFADIEIEQVTIAQSRLPYLDGCRRLQTRRVLETF